MGDIMKISKKIVGKPIYLGERTLIPTIELSTYSRQIKMRNNRGDLIITGVMVTPISFKVIEGEKEWILKIQENET